MFGIHFTGPADYGQLILTCAQTKPAFVLVANEDKAVGAVKTVSPNTKVAFRVTGHDGIDLAGNIALDYYAGKRRAEGLLPYFQQVPADYFIFANEWLSQDDPHWLACGCAAYQGIMDTVPKGMVVGIGDFSTAQPQTERADIREAMRPMLEQAQAQGHILNIHLYPKKNDPAETAQALIDRWNFVFENYPRLKVIVGEYAPKEGMTHGSEFENFLKEGERLLSAHPQIIGAALFEIGFGWSNFQLNIDEYKAHVTTV